MSKLQLFKRKILRKKYDFLDLGCKKGGSIGWCKRNYGGEGLGVDYNKLNVKEAREKGYDVIYGDVLKLNFKKDSFRYVGMMDFLEHLPDEEAAYKVLSSVKKWSREFFFIHHPSFEDIEYLKKLGLKIDWTDGYDHSNPLTMADFKRMFKKLGIKNYTINPVQPINDSSDKHILPLSAPHNTIFYKKELGPKKKIKFDHPVYSRYEIMVKL